MKKLAEHRKETLGKVVAKLNDEQKKTWAELIGAPFEFKPDPPRQNRESVFLKVAIFKRSRIKRSGIFFCSANRLRDWFLLLTRP